MGFCHGIGAQLLAFEVKKSKVTGLTEICFDDLQLFLLLKITLSSVMFTLFDYDYNSNDFLG